MKCDITNFKINIKNNILGIFYFGVKNGIIH